ncbi:uncharacterized protein LOC143199975 isoform X3 [Rhynchophorus ferrugineus]|uniref:uncharacterized protein LOC143199975 isoform X3 n=1 Tax=Rhynchophorus ferrugineus TaxID=354439 RepID=UPI003FCDAC66
MDIVPTGYVPGDPRLIEQIVYELKSQGIFDQFRKECIADVDTKPAYQNLRQRVEGSVNNFLKKQTFSGDMNKNQIREQLRKNISESGFLEIGVERIVDQVVNPKINTVFLPKVEDVVYRYLGLERPTNDIKKELKVEVTDLLPEDLEAVSPASVHEDICVNEDKMEVDTEAHNTSFISSIVKTEDESPPFEPLEENTKFSSREENIDQSGQSIGLDIKGKQFSSNLEIIQDISQSSQNSHDLSVEMSEENSKMEICEDSNVSNDRHEIDDKSIENTNEMKDIISDDAEKKEGRQDSDIKISDDKKSDSKRSYDKHKSRSDRKDDKDKRNRSKSESKSKDHKDYKSSSKHSSSKDRDKERKDYRNGKDRVDGTDKSKSDRNKDSDKVKEGDKYKDKSNRSKDSEREKDKSQKEKDRGDKGRSDKDRSRSSTSSNSNKYNKDSSRNSGKDKDKSGDRSQDKESSKSKESSSKDKDISKSSKEKDKPKSSSSSSSKDKDKRYSSSSRSSDKHKKNIDKDKPSDKKSSSSKKDKKPVDDHYSSKDKKSDRRSTDRDSNDGSSKSSRQASSFIDILGSKASSKESSEVFSSGSGDSNNSDKTDAAVNDTDSDSSAKDNSVEVQTIRYYKPKLACNVHEVMKIMKIRKQLARLERKNQLSLTDIELVRESVNSDILLPQKNYEEPSEKGQDHNQESPRLQTKELSMESFEALEAKLAEAMSSVDCSTYGEEDDNFEYTSVLFSPVKKRNSQDAANVVKDLSSNTFENQSNVNCDIKEEVEIVASHYKKVLPDVNGQEQVKGQPMLATIAYCSNEDNEKENKLQNNAKAPFKINIAKTGKKCFLNLQDDGNITDSNRSNDRECSEQSLMNNELSHQTNSQKSMLMSAEDNGPCYYFDRVNSEYLNNLEVLHRTIRKLESAIQDSSLKLQNIQIHRMRDRKRRFDNGESNNKASDLHPSSDYKKRHISEVKPEASKEYIYNSGLTFILDVPQNHNFNLPLSPAESDKSGEHKKEEPQTVKPKRIGRVSVGRANERYSNEDLYKPRPVFNYTSSRRRAKNEQL